MYSLSRTAALVIAIFVSDGVNISASPGFVANQSKDSAGSISGRVTLADKPAAGVTVMLTPGEDNTPINKPVARTTTDDDGRFQFSRVPAGNYLIQTFTPAFVGPNDTRRGPGKAIMLNDGETVDGVDIALTRGGVITGRIVDAEGQPLIEQHVRLFSVTERSQKFPVYLPYAYYFSSTDDRGVYRLFGVPPGRYLVGTGIDTTQSYSRTGSGSTYYALTYHPDVTDQSRATIIELASGGEATGIDIKLGGIAKAYEASGRIIDADTGKPVAGMNYGYGSLQPNGNSFGSSTITSATSNSRGEFRLDGVVPGRYAVFAGTSKEDPDFYSDTVLFQVIDADVTGLEVKVHRGSSLSGVITLEGGTDQNAVPHISEPGLGVSVSSLSLAAPHSNKINIGPDGSFRVKGLRPGNAHFFLMTYPPPKGLALLRVERDGVEQRGGVEIRAGEQVSGINVVFGYGTGIIRGQVNVEGGALPEGSSLAVSIYHAGGKPLQMMAAVPDMRGRFAFEGLLPGDYELHLATMFPASTGGRQPRPKLVRQTVSVANGVEAQVTFVIEMNDPK